MIDVYSNWNAQSKPHPGDDRINRSEPLHIRLGVGDVDCTRDTTNVTMQDLAVAHQFDPGRVADADPIEIGFLELSVQPERIGVDN